MADRHITADIQIDEAAFQEFITGFEVKEALELMAAAIIARAVPKMGRKSGDLQDGTVAEIVEEDDGLVLYFTSRKDGVEIPYRIHHWAPGKPGGSRSDWKGTTPFTLALAELGIEFVLHEGYPI